ncbi:VWA domain-containing protein [Halomicroarcula sp. GCM10025710]
MTANVVTDVNRPYVPGDGAKLTAEIEVDPGRREGRSTRQIALCIDSSGSMAGDDIQQARDGAEWVFGLLEDDDYVSIVTFDTDVETVLDATRWGDISREDALDRVDAITAGGGTDIYRGLVAARDSLHHLPTDDTTARRILFLSDGKDQNHGKAEFGSLPGPSTRTASESSRPASATTTARRRFGRSGRRPAASGPISTRPATSSRSSATPSRRPGRWSHRTRNSSWTWPTASRSARCTARCHRRRQSTSSGRATRRRFACRTCWTARPSESS